MKTLLALMLAANINTADMTFLTDAECGHLDSKMTKLTEEYHEVPELVGTIEGKVLVQFWHSPTTWTMTMTHTSGTMCYVAAGKFAPSKDSIRYD